MINFLRSILLLLCAFGSILCRAQAPNISYTTPQTYTAGTAITSLGPKNSGGAVSSGGYSITPGLPLGLVFDTTTGTISGNAAISRMATDYTVSAVNAAGSSSTVLNITVNLPQPPNISYGGSRVFTTTIPINPFGPVNTGGAVALQNALSISADVSSRAPLAIDTAGNVYAFDISGKLLQKFPAGGGAAVIIGSGFKAAFPSGIGVDGSGNVFLSDWGNSAVKKIPAGGGPPVVFGSGYGKPGYLVVDSAGNVYIKDDSGQIKKISADGSTTTTMHFDGVLNVNGLAIDGAGNLYISDLGDKSLKKVPANTATSVKLSSGFSNPAALFVDASGDIYVIDGGTAIKRVPAGGGKPVLFKEVTNVISAVFDTAGNMYFSDGSNSMKYFNKGGYYITPDLPAGLSMNHNTGVITGTPNLPSQAADYAITGYNAGGSSSTVVNITINHYPFPQVTYPESGVFSLNRPLSPPLTPVSANVAPFGNYAAKEVAPGLASGVAVDTSGNAYLALSATRTVVKVSEDGGNYVIRSSGFEPTGIAVDKPGNIYVVDHTNNAIKKIPVNGGPIVTIASGLFQPSGLAIDAAGNLYVTILGDGSIQKIPADGSSTTTLVPHFTQPRGVAVDLLGNIYIADSADGVIKKITTDNPGVAVPLTASNSQPYGVTVDQKGNVFFVEKTGTAIKEIPAGTTSVISVTSGISGAVSIATDNKNAFYVGNSNAFTTFTPTGGYFITQNLPAGLQFDNSTGVISGTPTTLSPAANYTITAYNQGGSTSVKKNIQVVYNAGLSRLALSAGALNPAFVSSTTTYSAIVPYAAASVRLTPMAIETGATITVNGTPVSSGVASPSQPLEAGPNTITTVVTSPDGIAAKAYTITVTRAAASLSANALLTSIKLAPNIALTKVAGPGYSNYTASVPNSQTSLAVIATHQDANSTITVNGQKVLSGAASQQIPLNVGDNVINITVTAQDSATIKTYVIAATRAKSSVATLSNLAISNGTLSPVFASSTISYTAIVPNAISAIKITPTATDTTAAIKINGLDVASGALSEALPLAVGANAITTTITAQDGTVKSYTTTVTRASADLSTNALLSSIKLTPATTLTAVTGPGYVNYTTSIPNSQASLTVIAIHQDVNSAITVNGLAVTSGTPSASIPLNIGDNVINIIVTAQDGATTKAYVITATRSKSPIATLSSLALSLATISPVYTPATTNYTATVPYTTSSIQLTPTATDANATIQVNSVIVATGMSSGGLPLAVGSNIITTVVTAQDGTTTKTYSVIVTRASADLSTNALLTSLKVTPSTALTKVAGPGYVNYVTSVSNSETSLTVTATHQDANSTITVNGQAVASGAASQQIPLNIGDNLINIAVTAQDGATKKTYIITAKRAASPVATLSSLALSNGTPAPKFSPENVTYNAVVPNAISSIKVIPAATEPDATLTINGTAVLSGTESAYLPLAVGSNTVTIVVTAPDGTTTKTYALMIIRASADLSNNALLTTLKVTPATTLTKVTGPGFSNYTTNVPSSESSLTITATRQDANSTITVNGQAVTSGMASQAIALAVGDNVINVVVTAQDGATTKTYTIIATRAAATGLVMKYDEPAAMPVYAGVTVHQSLSPNGDGDNDVLTIDGITNYPNNTLQIMTRNGELVYQVKGYDNRNRAFDGTSNLNGRQQPAGTYFYLLDYKDGNETKHKTGYIVVRY